MKCFLKPWGQACKLYIDNWIFFKRRPKHLDGLEQHWASKSFVLLYSKNEIGYLSYQQGKWLFEYSDWFKNQNRISPLIELPFKSQLYESKVLWVFFSSRIPSVKQPKIKKLYERGEKPSIADLLEISGKRTINNSFVLKAR